MIFFFFFSSRRRHTRWPRDWSSDVCSSDLGETHVPETGLCFLLNRQSRPYGSWPGGGCHRQPHPARTPYAPPQPGRVQIGRASCRGREKRKKEGGMIKKKKKKQIQTKHERG